jgi:uncharacterized tellurite resistance protein B-like protein
MWHSMLELLRQLLAPNPAPLTHEDARRALAALLVRAARVNGDYAAVEVALIDRLLARRYGLKPDAASLLRREAEELEAEAPDTVRFTRAIKAATEREDRVAELEMLWEVVLADGVRDHEEAGFMRLAADLLGFTDRESALARQRVEARGT